MLCNSEALGRRGGISQKRSGTTSPPKYKLVRQSPLEVLTPYFGQTVTFVLAKPLLIRRGTIVALTIPTWAPAFAVNLASSNVWRASRNRNKCDKVADIKAGSSHNQVGNVRNYACAYKGAKLTYSATLAKG